MRLEEYAIDDLHQCALAEFELDEDAQCVLNSLYRAMQTHYIAVWKLMRFRREQKAPWESAAS